MKKLLTLILVLLCINSKAQFISEFETGYRSYKNRLITDESNRYKLNSFFSTFYFGYQYKQFKAITETSIFYNKSSQLVRFSPKYSEFLISFNYQLKNIIFSYSHLCTHPIANTNLSYNDSRKFWESYDKLSIKIILFPMSH